MFHEITQSAIGLLDAPLHAPEQILPDAVHSTGHLTMVERVIQIMRTHFSQTFSLADLADLAGMSPSHFNRVFHRQVGIPPCEFLATLRMEAAKRLLLTTELSVTDICFEVGYSGLGSFTTRFTQQVGMPPRHLRLRARQNILSVPVVTAPIAAPLVPSLAGRVSSRYPFNGLIFIGLFPRPIPQGRPVSCTQLYTPGPFQLNQVPDGYYYLLCAAFPLSRDPQTYLLPGETLLIGSQGPLYLRKGGAPEPVELHLRRPNITDPPIITAVPFSSLMSG